MKKELLMVGIAVALWSCGDGSKEDEGGEKTDNQEETVDNAEGHDHGDGHDHDHDHDHDHGAVWAEADAFHEYMASTWHPADSDGDFEPIMEKARDMAIAAEAWAASDIPEEYNKEGVSDILEMLSTESDALANMVEEGASNEEIYDALNALHNLFHEIVEKCSDGDHHHHHDHDHDHDHGDDGHDHSHE